VARPSRTDFGDEAVRPFLARSLPAAAGHPASDDPLTAVEERDFQTAFERVREETAANVGLRQHGASDRPRPTRLMERVAHPIRTNQGPERPDTTYPALRVDTLLPHTRRMPDCVDYDAEADAIRCQGCENRYDPSVDGMHRAIECCHTLAEVDSDDIPVCEFNLKLTPEEVLASGGRWRSCCSSRPSTTLSSAATTPGVRPPDRFDASPGGVRQDRQGGPPAPPGRGLGASRH